MELGEYIEAHKPPDGFPKASGVCEDRVDVGRGAKTLIRAINVRTEEHDVFDSLVWVSASTVRCYVQDSLLGEERIESYLFCTKLRSQRAFSFV
jgi:hypothetical protein